MKILSLWQPWASLIGRGKSIETRSWETLHRGPLAIHAAKRWTAEEQAICKTEPFLSELIDNELLFIERFYSGSGGEHSEPKYRFRLPFGAVVAVCTLADCRATGGRKDQFGCGPKYADWVHALSAQELDFGNYSPGRFGWILEGVRILDAPIPLIGRQGLWNADLPELERSDQ